MVVSCRDHGSYAVNSSLSQTLFNNTFSLYNVLHNGHHSVVWKNVGYFGKSFNAFDTIHWPGGSLFGPIQTTHRIYRIVTIPAEPFVFVKGPMDSGDSCLSEVRCVKVLAGDPRNITFDSNTNEFRVYGNVDFQYYCCSGIAVDILHKLSIDLKFDFVLYFTATSDYGRFDDNNGTWSGVVGHVVDGIADVAIGALTITTHRLQHMTFTEPFHSSGYLMVTLSTPFLPSIDAFTRPFDISVWLCIFLSASVTGFATSLLEWNSPFGLNPWGKKRCRNYTLGSGLVMAYSILFGHTVYTKTPKCWPSKWVQNVWSALAIFIIASYTANLAAYLAGNTGHNTVTDIYDNEVRKR